MIELSKPKHRSPFKHDCLAIRDYALFAAIVMLELLAMGTSLGQVPVINSFDASPNTVILGSCSTLNWSTTDAVSVYIDQEIGVVQPNGSRPLKPEATTTCTMVAINGNNSTSASATIEVIRVRPTVNYYDAEPIEVGIGGSSNLSWNVTGATLGVTIDPDGSTVPMLGNKTIFPVGRAQYALNATNESGSTIRTVIMGCINPSANLTSTPSRILYGDSAILEWNASEASKTSFDQGIGSVPAKGTKTVSPEEQTTYTLSAFNPCDEIAMNSTTIDVNHEIYNFVTRGEDASWSGSNGEIPYGTSLDDKRGSAALVTGKLVGDQTEGLRLWTHPTWMPNGYIEGVYDLTDFMIPGRTYTPDQRDHISGEYGLFDDSCYGIGCIWCGEVTFQIILRSEGIPDFTLVGPTRLNCGNTRNEFDAFIPAQFTGRPIKIVLRVDAGSVATLDHAGWKDVILSRG